MGARRGRGSSPATNATSSNSSTPISSSGPWCAPPTSPSTTRWRCWSPTSLQHGPLAEVQIDRGYLGSPALAPSHARGRGDSRQGVDQHQSRAVSQAGLHDRSRRGPRRLSRPADRRRSPVGATTVHFAAAVCQPCALRAACTTARGGRSIAIHPQEALLQTLRAHQQQPEGRAHLRERTTVEHSLARVDQIQGPKARYKGMRKNTLDLRRVAVIANLQRIARLPKAA